MAIINEGLLIECVDVLSHLSLKQSCKWQNHDLIQNALDFFSRLKVCVHLELCFDGTDRICMFVSCKFDEVSIQINEGKDAIDSAFLSF